MLAAADLCTLAGGSSRSAFAAEGGAGLRFEYVRTSGAADCPDAAAVRAGVIARLGRDPFSPDSAHSLRCEISGDRSGRRAQIELRDRTGRITGVRTLSSKRGDCTELAPALMVVIASASAWDASTAAGEPGAAERPAPARGPAPSSEPRGSGEATPSRRPAASAPAAAQPTAPDARADKTTATAASRPAEASPAQALGGPTAATPVAFSVSAGVTFGAGSGPGWAGGGLVGVGVNRGWGSLELELFGTLPSSRAVGSGRIMERAAGVSVVPCAHRGPLAGCALVQAGFLFGRGEDLPGARTGRVAWVAAGLRAGWRLRLHRRLALDFHADGVLVPTRTDVHAGDDLVWTRPVWAADVGVTFVVELGRPRERQTDGARDGQY